MNAQPGIEADRIPAPSLSCDDSLEPLVTPAHRYAYKPLALDAIRLIRILPLSTPGDIHCALEHHTGYSHGALQYTALSYCWGDSADVMPITIDGCKFSVTINLWDALSSIIAHYDSSKLYWADAVCLDQSNVRERNHQVHQMWRIYSNAELVVAWLGLENNESEGTFASLSEVTASCRSESMPCPGWGKHHVSLTDSDTRRLRSFTRNEFFGRTWIISEFVLSRRLLVARGKHSVDGDALYHLQRLWLGSQIGELISARWRHQGKRAHDHDSRSSLKLISDVLYTYSMSCCTDCRDRIFALLGHPAMRALKPREELKPDYSQTPGEIALVFLTYCDDILEEDLSISKVTPDQEPQIRGLIRSVIRALDLACRPDNLLARTLSDLRYKADHQGVRKILLNNGDSLQCNGVIFRYLKRKTPQFAIDNVVTAHLNAAPPPYNWPRFPSMSTVQGLKVHIASHASDIRRSWRVLRHRGWSFDYTLAALMHWLDPLQRPELINVLVEINVVNELINVLDSALCDCLNDTSLPDRIYELRSRPIFHQQIEFALQRCNVTGRRPILPATYWKDYASKYNEDEWE